MACCCVDARMQVRVWVSGSVCDEGGGHGGRGGGERAGGWGGRGAPGRRRGRWGRWGGGVAALLRASWGRLLLTGTLPVRSAAAARHQGPLPRTAKQQEGAQGPAFLHSQKSAVRVAGCTPASSGLGLLSSVHTYTTWRCRDAVPNWRRAALHAQTILRGGLACCLQRLHELVGAVLGGQWGGHTVMHGLGLAGLLYMYLVACV